MHNDRLIEILQHMLLETHVPEETAALLIRRAAGAYAVELLEKAEIPFAFRDDVLADLEGELLVVYRKMTYGYFSLKDFRAALYAHSEDKD